MNNTEKKIDWIFEALRYLIENTPSMNNSIYGRKNKLLDDADRIIADIETEKESNPTIQSKTENALRDHGD